MLPRDSRHPRGDVLTLAGEIDAHTAPELRHAISQLNTDADVELDMSDVGFIDSSGLRVILEAHDSSSANGRRLVLSRPSRAVRRLIEISGLNEHLGLPTDG